MIFANLKKPETNFKAAPTFAAKKNKNKNN